jgi:hypothetical protein
LYISLNNPLRNDLSHKSNDVVNGHKYSPYISYKTIFQKNYCEIISKPILIIFAPEEAEIFKDYSDRHSSRFKAILSF